jgi:hypothetical protein
MSNAEGRILNEEEKPLSNDYTNPLFHRACSVYFHSISILFQFETTWYLVHRTNNFLITYEK